MDPLTMMAVQGGLSLVSGLGARQSAKSQQKRQAANDMIANQVNEQRIAEKNRRNLELGKSLLKEKETTREQIHEERTETTASAIDNYSYVDVEGMMDAAERAGFNPVTWLNAGGMQAYTQTGSRGLSTTESLYKADNTTTRRGHNAAAAYALMSPESAMMTSSQATNIPSVGEVLGKAGSDAFGVYRQELGKQQSQDFQRELLNLQLDAIQKNKGSTVQGGHSVSAQTGNGTPSFATSGGTRTAGGAASTNGGLSSGVNASTGFDVQKPEQVNPFPDTWFKVNPSMPAASTIEDYGGDLLGSLYAVPKTVDDLTYSATGGTGFFEIQAYGAKKTFQKVKDLTSFDITYDPHGKVEGGIRFGRDPNYVPYNKRMQGNLELPFGP